MNLLAKLTSIPQLLSGGYGILIRGVLIALVCAGIWAWGATWGYQHEEAKLDVFQAQVDTLAKQAAARAAERKAAQDAITKKTGDDHAKDVAAIRAYYALRLHDAASRRVLPPAPDGAGRADGATSECRPGDEGDEDVAMIELEERAALDAEKVLKLQAFLRENGFPVR